MSVSTAIAGFLAVRHHNAADTVAGIVAFLALVPILFVVVMLIVRHRRARGAVTRYQVMRQVFGERGARRIIIGSFGLAVIFFVLSFVVRATGG